MSNSLLNLTANIKFIMSVAKNARNATTPPIIKKLRNWLCALSLPSFSTGIPKSRYLSLKTER